MTIFLNYMITLSHYSNNTDIRIIRVTRISALLARHKHAPVEIMFLSLDEGKKKKKKMEEEKRKGKKRKIKIERCDKLLSHRIFECVDARHPHIPLRGDARCYTVLIFQGKLCKKFFLILLAKDGR